PAAHPGATGPRFNNSDAVAAGVRASPATRSAGATAPPTRTATVKGRHDRWIAARRGGLAATHGSTAIAAPMYRRPARTSVGTSPARSDAAGVDAPKSTAAARQR